MGWIVSVTPRPRFYPRGKGPPVPIVQEAGWASEPVWTQRLEEKIHCPRRGSNPDRPVVQPVVRHYTDWATRLRFTLYFCFLFCLFFVIALCFIFYFLLCVVFVFCVLVHWTLPLGGNPVAVNKTNLIILYNIKDTNSVLFWGHMTSDRFAAVEEFTSMRRRVLTAMKTF
jgi:hypothetical protein